MSPDAAVRAETREPERRRPMSEARDPRAGDTISIPPDSSQAETVTVDSAAPASGLGAPPGRRPWT